MDPTPPIEPSTDASESAPNPEKAAAAKALLEGIVSRMGIAGEVAVDDRSEGIFLQITAHGGGEALGSGGREIEVLESLTYVLNKALNRDEEGRKWVHVGRVGEVSGDVSMGPEPVADPSFRGMATELMQKAKLLGGALWLGPLPGAMRGLIPALQEEGARVRAEGEGMHRRFVVDVELGTSDAGGDA